MNTSKTIRRSYNSFFAKENNKDYNENKFFAKNASGSINSVLCGYGMESNIFFKPRRDN